MSPETLAVICGISGVLGVAAGAALLIVGGRALRGRTVLRRWLLETDLLALLDRRLTVERFLYRHHRVFGAAVVAGALASLATLWQLRDHPLAMAVLSGGPDAWRVGAVVLASMGLVVFALGIGLFLLIRPSALKRFETAANRWIEPFPPSVKDTVPAETGINRLILRAPRFTGLLLIAAGLACLLAVAG